MPSLVLNVALLALIARPGVSRGKVLDLVRDALASDAAQERAMFRPEYVTALLADPNGELTPLKGNQLWQLGLLELWLQTHAV